MTKQFSKIKKLSPKITLNKIILNILGISSYLICFLLFIPFVIFIMFQYNFLKIESIYQIVKDLNLSDIYNCLLLAMLIFLILNIIISLYEFILGIISSINYKRYIKQEPNIPYEKTNAYSYIFGMISFIVNITLFIFFIIQIKVEWTNEINWLYILIPIDVISLIFFIFEIINVRRNQSIYSYYENI